MRKQPETSKEAYLALTLETKNKHYGQILKALKALGSATYEEIATFVGLEPSQVGRRLKEMRDNKLLFISGLKKPTKKGRAAFVHYIVGSSQPKTENEVNYAKSPKVATEYAKDLIKQAELFIQN